MSDCLSLYCEDSLWEVTTGKSVNSAKPNTAEKRFAMGTYDIYDLGGTDSVSFAHTDRERKRIPFLEWVRDTYEPSLLLYAGSGFDTVPRDIFGKQVVVHLSKEEGDRPLNEGYFLRLGHGMKIGADFLWTPLKDGSVDAVYVHESPAWVTTEAIGEFSRVLRQDGILILDSGGWMTHQVAHFTNTAKKYLRHTGIPHTFCDPQDTWRMIEYAQFDLEGARNGIVVGYARTLERTQRLLDQIPARRRTIVEQHFGIFAKT